MRVLLAPLSVRRAVQCTHESGGEGEWIDRGAASRPVDRTQRGIVTLTTPGFIVDGVVLVVVIVTVVVLDRPMDEQPVDDCAPRGRKFHGSVLWPLVAIGVGVASRRAGEGRVERRGGDGDGVPMLAGAPAYSPSIAAEEREANESGFSRHAASRRSPTRVVRVRTRTNAPHHLSRSLMRSSTFPDINRLGGCFVSIAG